MLILMLMVASSATKGSPRRKDFRDTAKLKDHCALQGTTGQDSQKGGHTSGEEAFLSRPSVRTGTSTQQAAPQRLQGNPSQKEGGVEVLHAFAEFPVSV